MIAKLIHLDLITHIVVTENIYFGKKNKNENKNNKRKNCHGNESLFS